MSRNTSIGLFAAAVISTVALAGPNSADARDRHRNRAGRQEIRQDWAEIRRDRVELRRDIREYNRDRDALRRSYRRGASPGRVDHLRDEVRHGRQEIFHGRRELRDDYAKLRRDFDRRGFDRHGYGRDDNRGRGWWHNDDRGNRGRDYNRYGFWNRDRVDRWGRGSWRD